MNDVTRHDGQEGQEASRLQRLATEVPGLDAVLCGGLFVGRAYVLRGAPGVGKTTLANQICFEHARAGGQALFVTLLAEGHARMLQHLEAFSFYDAALVPERVYYISGFDALEEGGLEGLMALLHRELRARQPTVLVLDGLLAAKESAATDRAFRKFLHELQARLATQDCTALLLTNSEHAEYHAEYTMVDGLIALENVAAGKREQRELEVRKLRGSDVLLGRHAYRITKDGLVVYPRIEALLTYPSGTEGKAARKMSTGLPDLDAMTGGGLPVGSATLMLGASGTGKTTLGLHFLAQSSAREPGLYFGFYEMPERLMANAATMGIDLAGLVRRGHLETLWRPATEQILDDLGGQLIEAVRRRGVRRLFVDSLTGLVGATETPERIPRFFAALSNELRTQGVTILCSAETTNLVGPAVSEPIKGISAAIENLLLLRFAEHRGRLYRLLSVLKVRGSGFDPRVHEFQITDTGARLAGTFEDAEGILGDVSAERPGKKRKAHKATRRTARSTNKLDKKPTRITRQRGR